MVMLKGQSGQKTAIPGWFLADGQSEPGGNLRKSEDLGISSAKFGGVFHRWGRAPDPLHRHSRGVLSIGDWKFLIQGQWAWFIRAASRDTPSHEERPSLAIADHCLA